MQYIASDGKHPHPENSREYDGISTMLASYQLVVKSLLSKGHYPGVSAEDLDLFKSQFRTSAYVCRLGSCPLASLGFESEQLLLQHEMAHIQRLQCTFPGCQYPPLGSVISLKNHMKKYHSSSPMRNSIRRARPPPAVSGNKEKLPTASPWEPSVDLSSPVDYTSYTTSDNSPIPSTVEPTISLQDINATYLVRVLLHTRSYPP